ncbi:MAG TPA: hydrogenase nickel incorporation protein HypB [Acidimicrobiales bacterium]
MCATCGCSDSGVVVIDGEAATHEHLHDHPHPHDHPHDHTTHDHDHDHGEVVTLEQQVLARNDLGAARNRGWFEGRGILALNLMSSPGAGKTTLLVRTITDLLTDEDGRGVAVVEGDQETAFDAERVRATGADVVQVNTGSGCHLDAEMLARALQVLDPAVGSLVMIENVGNLVCPALFDLGEAARVVIMSVTEGDDKPLKYPHMFRRADLLVLNKLDLLPHVEFDVDRCTADARRLNPDLEVVAVSATRGDGLDDWYDWLDVRGGRRRPQPVPG